MSNDRISELLTLILSHQATENHKEELQKLLDENPDEQFNVEVLLHYFNNGISKPQEHQQYELEEHFTKILNQTETETKNEENGQKSILRKLVQSSILKYAVAACIISVVALATITIFQNKPSSIASKNQLQEVIVKKGTKTRVQLPDGTIVIVNADSKISYAANFNEKTRDVYLEGEAYFDVAKNKHKPFIVHTNGIDVKVLGTVFNVKAYTSDSTVETTLIEGSVQVFKTNNYNAPLVTLKPNEKATFLKNTSNNKHYEEAKQLVVDSQSKLYTSSVVKSAIDSSIREISWVHNKLSFENETLIEMIPSLERWFNVEIEVEQSAYFNKKMRVHFENETLEQVLQSIDILVPLQYSIKNNKVHIYKK